MEAWKNSKLPNPSTSQKSSSSSRWLQKLPETCMYRRTARVDQLNQLRDQAIKELRSMAGLEGAPTTLPGSEADEWIEWAVALKEPEDAESLQTLRSGFPHLDEFIANLEPDMWTSKVETPA